MGRLKKAFTLIELIAATILIATVALMASSFLITFNNFYAGFAGGQANIELQSLAILNEIVNKITTARSVSVTASVWLNIWIDETNATPSDLTDDTKYSYLFQNKILTRTIGTGPQIQYTNFNSMLFTRIANNQVRIIAGIKLANGQEKRYQTTVVARCMSAQ